MIELLLSVGLTCSESQHIINNIKKYGIRGDAPSAQIQELIDVVKKDNPECSYERSE